MFLYVGILVCEEEGLLSRNACSAGTPLKAAGKT
jgi:hypothetical protein